MRWLLAALVLAAALAVLGAAWLLGTESGLHWAAARAVALTDGKASMRGLRGALAGDIGFDEFRYQDGGTDIRLTGGEVSFDLLPLLGGRAVVRSLRAEQLDIVLGDGGTRPHRRPSVPLTLRVDSAEIAQIRYREFTVEDFGLTGAAVSEQGAVSGVVSFAVRQHGVAARLELSVGGTVERVNAALSGSLADVPVSAKALVAPFAEQPLQAIDARAGPADLSRVRAEWPRTSLTLELQGEASSAGRLSGTVALRNAAPGPLDKQRAPLATVDARFVTDFASVSLHDLRATGAGTVHGNAQLDPREARLELRVADLNLRALQSTLRQTRLTGPLSIIATRDSQSLKGTLAQDGMSLSADAARTGEVVEVRSLRAAAEGGVATGTARLRLSQPMRFETDLELANFDPARFGDYPYGSINGQLKASGLLGDDLSIDAAWTVKESALRGEAFASRGSARIARDRISRADAQAMLGESRLSARGAFGRPGDELALELESPDVGQFIAGLSGRVSADARLSGSWSSPRGDVRARADRLTLPNHVTLASVTAEASGALARHEGTIALKADGLDLLARLRGGWLASGWSGEIYALRNTGPYPLELSQPAPLAVAPDRVELGRFQARMGNGRLLVKQLAWSPPRLVSSGEFEGLPAQWLILAGGLAERARATLLLDGNWDLQATPELTGTLSLQRRTGDVAVLPDDVALALEKAALDVRFTAGTAKLTATLQAKYGSASIEGSLQGLAADSPLDVSARVRFAEMRTLLQPFVQDTRIDGRLSAELRASGTLREIVLAGSLEGNALALQMPPYGVFLRNGELRAALEGDRVRITRFAIAGSSGTFTASGTLPLRPADEAHLQWRAENFGLLSRPDLRLAVSGQGDARLADRKVSLSGALRAERGYLELRQEQLPKLGDDVVIVGKPRVEARQRARVPVALDVQLDLGDELQVRGYGLEGRLAGQLQVETTPEGELRAYGRIHTVNATFLAYGQRLHVDPGIAIFDGPLDNPSLQMTAWRRNLQVEAGVQVSGTARAPRVQLVSQPTVPEGERLSWLVLGRGPGDASKADLGLLQAAAGALLARGDQLPLDRRLAQAFGVDEISLRGSGEVGDRVVAVGKRLSDRLYVSYEHGLGVATSALVKLDLALSQRWSVRAETGTSSGLGLVYRFSWD